MKCRTASQRAAHPLQGIHNVGRFTRFSSDRIAMPAASGDVLAGNRVRRGASSPTTGASSERQARSPTHRSGWPAPPVARSDARVDRFRMALRAVPSKPTTRLQRASGPARADPGTSGHVAVGAHLGIDARRCLSQMGRTFPPRDTATDGARIGAAYRSRPGPRSWRPVSKSPRSSKNPTKLTNRRIALVLVQYSRAAPIRNIPGISIDRGEYPRTGSQANAPEVENPLRPICHRLAWRPQ